MADVFSRLRTKLLIRSPFFGALSMHLKPVPDMTIDTAMTNGVELRYNPEYLASLPEEQGITLLAHEVLHPALMHIFRRGARESMEWNVAADYVVNPILIEAGFQPIPGWHYDAQYKVAGKWLSAEEIYSKRQAKKQEEQQKQEKPQGKPQEAPGSGSQSQSGTQPSPGTQEQGSAPAGGKNQGGNGQSGTPTQGQPTGGNGCPTGTFEDAPTGTLDNGTPAPQEQDWQINVQQAVRIASAAGTLPGGFAEVVRAARAPRVDWVSELREFIVAHVPSDQSWASPNRRFVSREMYLPGYVKDGAGHIMVIDDTSGSTRFLQKPFAAEFAGILQEVRPELTTVVYVDTKVQRVDEFTADDFELDLKVTGMGGTLFQPAFDYIEKEGLSPLAIIFLTDLQCADKPKDPGIPVLWLTADFEKHPTPGFGRQIRIPIEGK